MQVIKMEMEEDAVSQGRLDLRKAVMIIDNELHDGDVQSLKFLCQGLIVGSKLKRVKAAHELISQLENAGHISGQDYFLLADMLQYISRVDVLEKIGYEEGEVFRRRVQTGSLVDPFYILLFKISEDLSDDDVGKAAFTYGNFPRSQKLSSGLDLFTVMYQHQAVGPEKTGPLMQMFETMERNDIVEMIRNYSATRGESVHHGLRQQFVRMLKMRGIDTASVFSHFNREPPGKSQAPCADDFDVQTAPQGNSQVGPQSVNSWSNHPASGPRSIGVGPSMSSMGGLINNPPATGLPSVISQQGDLPSIVAAPPELDSLDSVVIPERILEMLARNILDSYWEEISMRLGVPLATTGTERPGDKYFRNRAVLKRWLEHHDTVQVNPITARIRLVQALHYADVQLFAKNVAEQLNLDLEQCLMYSLPQSERESVYMTNEVSSAASAAHVPNLDAVHQSLGRREQISMHSGDMGDPMVAPVARQLNVMSLGHSPFPHYPMDANPRGICLIINNRDFYRDPMRPEAKQMINREGTDVDRNKLTTTFQDLNFIVLVKDNLTDTQMLQEVTKLSFQNHSQYDCFVCCILTHGVLGALYGVNGITLPIRDLTAPLRTQSCPTLADKPKLFFLQACQGKEKQTGFEMQTDSEALETDGPGQLIPNEADFLLGYATVPGFVSYRSKTRGSWYITKLTEMLRKYAYDHDILDILTFVNFEVGKGDADMEGNIYKQSPAPMYSLRKKLIFSRPQQTHGSNMSLRVSVN